MGNTGAVVVAAGKGTRMGTAESKQYVVLGDKPVIVHTLEVFERTAEIGEIVLVVGEGDVPRCRRYAERYGLAKVSAIVAGGGERQESVYRGLLALSANVEWVLVHDGVRPFITADDIVRCRREAESTGAAVLAVPVKDTIKVADADGNVRSTPDRRSLWAVQTPQAFRLSLLKRAHEKAAEERFVGTDDSQLVERIGCTVRIVEGDYRNIKLTTPDDLLWAEFAMRARHEGERRQ